MDMSNRRTLQMISPHGRNNPRRATRAPEGRECREILSRTNDGANRERDRLRRILVNCIALMDNTF